MISNVSYTIAKHIKRKLIDLANSHQESKIIGIESQTKEFNTKFHLLHHFELQLLALTYKKKKLVHVDCILVQSGNMDRSTSKFQRDNKADISIQVSSATSCLTIVGFRRNVKHELKFHN